MPDSFTFSVESNDSLISINNRLQHYCLNDYEKGSIKAIKYKNRHSLTIKVKSPSINLVSIPPSQLAWKSGLFPSNIRFYSNQNINKAYFDSGSFYLNNTQIPQINVSLESENYFSINITGSITGSLSDQYNCIEVKGSQLRSFSNFKAGPIWHAHQAQVIDNRSSDETFYRARGGRLKVDRLTIFSNTDIATEINKLKKTKQIEILDTSVIDNSNTNSVKAWVYVIYVDKEIFEVKNIFPNEYAVVKNTGSKIHVDFCRPIPKSITGEFLSRIKTTPYSSNTLYSPTSLEWSADRSTVLIDPNIATKQEGSHQLYIDLRNVSTDDGQFIIGPKEIWGSYYIYTGVPEGGTSTPGAGVPDTIPVVTWQATSDLSNEKTLTTGTYTSITTTATEIKVDLNTGTTSNIFTTNDLFTGHTGNASVHFTVASIDHGLLLGLGNDDHPHYTKTGDFSNHTGNLNIHYTTGEISILTGQVVNIGNLPFIKKYPTSNDNIIYANDTDVLGLAITGRSSNTNNLLTVSNSTFGGYVNSDIKARFNDLDSAFTDPNSHFQTGNTSLNSILEEIGYVNAQATRNWLNDCFNNISIFNQSTTLISSMGYVRQCTGATSDTTIGHKMLEIPLWAQADGGNQLYVDINWGIQFAPSSDLAWVCRVALKAFNTGDSSPAGSLTNTSTTIPVLTSYAATMYRQTTISITTPDLYASSKRYMTIVLTRLANGDAADTYTGHIYVAGVGIRSGVKYT